MSFVIVLLLLLIVGFIAFFIVSLIQGRDNDTSAFAKQQLHDAPVDLQRYAGQWYEIASLPNTFEKDCMCSSAVYTPDAKSGTIAVLNRCQLHNNEIKSAKAVAWPNNENNTWLKVNFLPGIIVGNNPAIATSWPFALLTGDYWILYVAEDYSEAIVGSPDQTYLWILSRTSTMTKAEYAKLVVIAQNKGYDTTALQLNCQLLLE